MSAIKRIGEWAYLLIKGSDTKLRFPSWMSDDEIVKATKEGKGLDMSHSARMQRAKEQGFDVESYRGINGDYNPEKSGYYQMFTSSPEDASEYGNHVIKAKLKTGKQLKVDAKGSNFNNLPISSLPDDITSRLHSSLREGGGIRTDAVAHAAREAGYDSVSFKNVYDKADNEIPLKPKKPQGGASNRDLLAELGIDDNDPLMQGDIPNIPKTEKDYNPTTVDVVFDPKNIRSINAAFDPAQKESSNLLASALPASLAGVMGYNALSSDEAHASLLQGDPLQPIQRQSIVSNDPYETFTETTDDVISNVLSYAASNPIARQETAEVMNMILGATGILGSMQLGSDVGTGARWLKDQYGDEIKRFFFNPNPGIDWSEYED
jgi:hypothetical protein